MADDDASRKEFDWDLPVSVPSIGVHRTLRVTSNESVGAVMIKLTSKLGRLRVYDMYLSLVHARGTLF